MTSEIVKTVANENYSIALVRSKLFFFFMVHGFTLSIFTGAARIYFLTQQRRSKRVNAGKLEDTQMKQRRTQRKHNVCSSKAL